MDDPDTELVLDDGVHFFTLLKSDPEQYGDCLKRTNALLDTVLLGLPPNYLTSLIRNEYGLETLEEQDVKRLQQSLVHKVAHELQSFLEDATADVLASHLGLSANEELRRLVNAEDLDVTGPTLRNDLQKRRQRKPVMRLLQSAAVQPGPERTSLGRQDVYKYRGLTLGGQVTSRGALAAVRRQEVLLSAEEVMLAVEHELASSGYRPLGLAGNEFVLEVPAAEADPSDLEEIQKIVHKGARRRATAS
jgi:hypothetical protein